MKRKVAIVRTLKQARAYLLERYFGTMALLAI